MAHHVSGIIAHYELLTRLGGAFAGQPYFVLAEGFAFMPLDHENLDNVAGLHGQEALGEFVYLSDRLIELLCQASRNGELAYIETEYFGGAGGQGAVVFRGGEMISGPDWREYGAVNDALSLLGIAGSDQRDIFQILRLDRYRSNDAFREQS